MQIGLAPGPQSNRLAWFAFYKHVTKYTNKGTIFRYIKHDLIYDHFEWEKMKWLVERMEKENEKWAQRGTDLTGISIGLL